MHTYSEKTKMYVVLCMHTCEEKKTFLGKDHCEVGGGNSFKRVYPARVYPTLVVLVLLNDLLGHPLVSIYVSGHGPSAVMYHALHNFFR